MNRDHTTPASLHVVVEGCVQGVGFRAFVRARAQALGLAGWACNRPDGGVEVAAAGSSQGVAELRQALLVGPPRAAVTGLRELPPVALHASDRFVVLKVPPADGAPRRPWWKPW